MNKLLGIAFGALSAVSYGTNPLFGVNLLKVGFGVDAMLLWRFVLGSLVILPLVFIDSKNLRIKLSQLAWVALLGFLFAFSAETFFWSFTVMAASVASTILFLYPIFVALIMSIFFKEKIGAATIMAIVMSFAGVAFLYAEDAGEAMKDNGLLGAIFVILSGLSYAFYIVIVKVTNLSDVSGLKITFYAMTFAAIALFFKCLISDTFQIPHSNLEIANIAALAILPTAISITAIAYSIKYAGATIAAVLGALEPLTAVALSVCFLGEKFTSSLGIGIILIVSAVMILTLSGATYPHLRRPKETR